MKAVICPVCLGKGVVDEKKCRGCDGKGWVSVPDEHYYPFYPPPWHPSPPPLPPRRQWYHEYR